MRRSAILLLLIVFAACTQKSGSAGAAKVRRSGDPATVDALLKAAANSHSRKEALDALKETGAAAAPRLMQHAQLNDPMRSDAWIALGLIKHRDAVPLLLGHLGDADANIARDAAYALGNIGDARAVDPLFAILQRKHTKEGEELQKAAGSALGMIGAPAVDKLLAALDNKDVFVRTYAAVGLGEAKDARAIPALARHLADEVGESSGLQYEMGMALNKIGPQGVAAVLEAAKNPDERVRSSAVTALGNSSDPRAQPALLQLLHDESPSIRSSVGFFFAYKSVDAGTHKYLAEALQKKDWVVIQGAMPYYVQRGIAGSEPTLIEAMNRIEGDLTVANLFLNSGNPTLKAAAMKWASKNGYDVKKETEDNIIHQQWGAAR